MFTNVSKGEVAKKADLTKCFEETKGTIELALIMIIPQKNIYL